jgi:uncharacterized protein YbjT (DUF2867 family)
MLTVTGATGTIGRTLIDVLVNQGAKVRIITHSSQAAALPAEVEVVEGDLSRPATIAPHLEGVTALFLHPRAVGLAAVELLALARQRGVQRVVALSATNVDDPLDQQPSRYQGDRNKEVENVARFLDFVGESITRAAEQAREVLYTKAEATSGGTAKPSSDHE